VATVAKTKRLVGVDTLRAFAAVLVVVGHDLHFINELPHALGGGIHIPMFGAGLGAILLLFAAGFMSVYVGWNRFGEAGQSSQYLLKRAARLVPFYWFFTTVWLLIALLLPQLVSAKFPSAASIIMSYLFIPHRNADGFIYPILALGWTMNYIFLFDVITALFLRFRRDLAIAAIILTSAALAVAHRWTFQMDPAIYFWTGRFVVLYAGGALMSLIYKTWVEPAGGFTLNGWWSTFLLLGGVAASAPFLQSPFGYEFTHDFIALLPIVAFMGVVAVLTRESASTPIQWVRDKVAMSAYSVYLTHPFTLGIAILVWKKAHLYTVLSPWMLFVGALVASLIVAYVVHVTIEVRVNKLAWSLLFGRRQQPRAATAG